VNGAARIGGPSEATESGVDGIRRGGVAMAAPSNDPTANQVGASDHLAKHPRIANKNPLVDSVAGGADAKRVIPGDAVIVRGGRTYQPRTGEVISGQLGSNATEAASGIPHGTIRVTSAGEIRAQGGTVEPAPEPVSASTIESRL
jgi:hypothetical protein